VVEALDHSQGMLDRAAAKARLQGLTLATSCGDAERLEAADGTFDCVVSLFVLKHLPHPERAAAEMARVLVPGGRAVIGVGAAPALLSAAGAKAALRRLSGGRELTAPHFLRRILGEMGMTPEFELHAHADVAAMLRAAGLTGIRARWTGGAAELDPEGFWEVQAVFGSEERVLLERASDEVRAEVKRRFLERAAAARAEGARLVYRFGAMIWRAEKLA
jgi:SAM-dependent methyltransferase